MKRVNSIGPSWFFGTGYASTIAKRSDVLCILMRKSLQIFFWLYLAGQNVSSPQCNRQTVILMKRLLCSVTISFLGACSMGRQTSLFWYLIHQRALSRTQNSPIFSFSLSGRQRHRPQLSLWIETWTQRTKGGEAIVIVIAVKSRGGWRLSHLSLNITALRTWHWAQQVGFSSVFRYWKRFRNWINIQHWRARPPEFKWISELYYLTLIFLLARWD